jgi:hypothetical protein
MGRVAFTSENKVNIVNFDYPKLKLKNQEKARVLVGLESPVMEYVHTLRKPIIENGRPVIVINTNEKTGVESKEFKKAFVGTPICLGDESILADKGMDPKNCPACALAKEHPDMADAPKPRYAMHVFRYLTKAGTFTPSQPFAGQLLVWSFAGTIFNKIVEAKEEWGNLLEHDLQLGPCTNEGFQKFDIAVAAEAAWQKSEANAEYVKTTFRENQIPDLTIAVGRKVQAAWMKQDIEGIQEAWAQVSSAPRSSGGTSSTSLGEDLNSILQNSEPTPEPDWAESTGDASTDATFADLAKGLGSDDSSTEDDSEGGGEALDADSFASLLASSETDETADEPAEEAPAPAKKTAAKKPAAPAPVEEPDEPAVDNFDDLLGLGK